MPFLFDGYDFPCKKLIHEVNSQGFNFRDTYLVVATSHSVVFQGIEVKDVEVQVQLAKGLPAFNIVGLPDKAVAESKERIRSALQAIGLSLPTQRITVNLSPADLHKEGSHFDLPIALCLLSAMEIVPRDVLSNYIILGELALDSRIQNVQGILPAAIHAVSQDRNFICPHAQAEEASWASNQIEILAPKNLLNLINHFKGQQVLAPFSRKADLSDAEIISFEKDLHDVRGQETAKRALTIAAAGRHNMLMIGPPGSGKSMLAQRLPSILPPLESHEVLETSMIHSLSGQGTSKGIVLRPPYRDPHHTASTASIIGGGQKIKPGEISLAHNGVLFLDELPEFKRDTLESLRQPIETGEVLIARAANQARFPAQFQLIAAMNPCKCGYLSDPARACNKAPVCGANYKKKLSGPLLDRFDIFVEVNALPANELTKAPQGEKSETILEKVKQARAKQYDRYKDRSFLTNAAANDSNIEELLQIDDETYPLLEKAVERFGLSGRGYIRLLKVARTVADLNGQDTVKPQNLAEALAFRYFQI